MAEDDHANQLRSVIGHRRGDRVRTELLGFAIDDRDAEATVARVAGHQANPQRRFNGSQFFAQRLINPRRGRPDLSSTRSTARCSMFGNPRFRIASDVAVNGVA